MNDVVLFRGEEARGAAELLPDFPVKVAIKAYRAHRRDTVADVMRYWEQGCQGGKGCQRGKKDG